jgi:hypothetical protein
MWGCEYVGKWGLAINLRLECPISNTECPMSKLIFSDGKCWILGVQTLKFLYVKLGGKRPQLFWNATNLVALKKPAGLPAFRFEIPIR